MGEYKWLGKHVEEKAIGGRQLPSAKETDRQVDADIAEMFGDQPDDEVHTQYPGEGKIFAEREFSELEESLGSMSVSSTEGGLDG